MRNSALKEFNAQHFNNLQVCLSSRGTESTALAFRAAIELFPQLDKLFFDGDNGFNMCNRGQGLWQVLDKFPAAFSLVNMIYGRSASAFVLARDGYIDSITSSEGVQQGDVLSMWLYSLTIHPLVLKIQSIIDDSNSTGLNIWYADDGNIMLSFDIMCRVLQILISEGPTYGYFIKFEKCRYLATGKV